MPVFKIPVSWEVYGYCKIEADTLDEAIEIAIAGTLPDEEDYIEGSFNVDMDLVNELNTEKGQK